jgi:hypothetical protein
LSTLVLCLLVLWTVVLQASTSQAMAAPMPLRVLVTGCALDVESGKPVSGALIGVYESGQKTVKTDSRGRFKVWAAPGGKRVIYYDGGNPLYRSDGTTYTYVDVPAKGLSGAVLRLWQVQFAKGKVFTPSGMPLVGASVTMGGAYFTHTVTDSKGKFKIEAPSEDSKPGG